LNLAGAMIFLGNKAASLEEGKEISQELIKNGKAFDKFVEIVKHQKGDTKFLFNPDKYPDAKYSKKILSPKSGYLSFINNYEIGLAAVELGAGRKTKEDKIDPKAGIIFYPKISNQITKGSVLAEVFSDDKRKLEIASKKIVDSLKFSKSKIKKLKLIKKIII
jgi:thymidine phosphorylase